MTAKAAGLVAIAVTGVLALSACGGDSPNVSSGSESTAPSAPAKESVPATAPAASDAASSATVGTGEPATSAPASDAPTMDAPTTDAPSTVAPTTDGASPGATSDRVPPADGGPGSAKQLLSRSVAAMKSAGSMKASGQIMISQYGSTPTKMEFWGPTTGTDAAGSMGEGSKHVEYVTTGGKVYLKGGADFWKVAAKGKIPDSAAALMANKWVLAPSSAGSEFTQMNLGSLLTSMADSSSMSESTPVTEETLDGKPVWVIKEKNNKAYIAKDGQPYLLRMESLDAEHNRLDFSDFGSAPAVTAPPASEVIDPKTLAGAAG